MTILHRTRVDSFIHGWDLLKNKISFFQKATRGIAVVSLFAWVCSSMLLALLFLLVSQGLFGQAISILVAKFHCYTHTPGEIVSFVYYLDGKAITLNKSAEVIANDLSPYWDKVVFRIWVALILGVVPAIFTLRKAYSASAQLSKLVSEDDFIRGASLAETADEMNSFIDQDEQEECDRWAETKTQGLLENEGVNWKNMDPVQFKARVNTCREDIVKQRRKLVDISIGGVKIPVDRETQGIYLVGSPGSGKTVSQRKMMHMARRNESKVMFLDPKPELIAEFCRPGYDIFLNPLAELVGLDDTIYPSALWTPWAEITELPDYFSMAEAIVTVRPDDKVPFPAMANSVLGGLFELTKNFKEFNDLRVLTDAELETKLLTTLNVGAIKDGWKTGNAIARQTLDRATRVFKLLRDPEEGEEVFSINKWVKDDSDRRNVFISFPDKHRALLAPLITLWFDVAFRSMLDLQENNALPRNEQRRICFLLEELAALGQPIPMLRAAAERGRSFGQWLIITNQDPAQLDLTYTPEVARTIRNCLNTWLVFRCNDYETAEIMMKQIGEKEIYEKSESISSGADDDDPDGSTYSSKRTPISLVIKEEIMKLRPNHGYLIMYGQYPVFKFYEPPMGTPRTIKRIQSRKEILVDHNNKAAFKGFTGPSGVSAIDSSSSLEPVVVAPELNSALNTVEASQQEDVGEHSEKSFDETVEFQSDFASLDINAAFGITDSK